jgi:alkylhydroperoxidase family enzyme
VTLDEAFVTALVEDYDHAPLALADRAMLDYVGVLTKDATRVTPEHHRRLREAGFDDRGILQVTLIASWFNYINRVADALGVGRDPVEADGAATSPWTSKAR